jgi:hypothetical protein
MRFHHIIHINKRRKKTLRHEVSLLIFLISQWFRKNVYDLCVSKFSLNFKNV